MDSLLRHELKAATEPSGVAAIMIEQAAKSARLHKKTARASLIVEILAKASRNPKIRRVIQTLQQELQTTVLTLLGDDGPRTKSRLEILAAMMDGFAIREVRNPRFDEDLDCDMVRQVVRHIFTA